MIRSRRNLDRLRRLKRLIARIGGERRFLNLNPGKIMRWHLLPMLNGEIPVSERVMNLARATR
jgi:hypothetical protein